LTDVAVIAKRPVEAALMEAVASARLENILAPEGIVDRSDCLPPDLDYSLDCEQEQGGIGHDDRAYIDLFDGDASNTYAWFLPLTRGNARTFPDIVKTRHARWRETAPIAQRMALTWGGLEALKWLFDGCVSDFAYQAIHHHGMSEFPDGAETAYVEAMDVAGNPGLLRFADCARPIVARAVQDIGVVGPEAFLAARGSLDVLYADARDRINERNRRVNEMLRSYAENTITGAVRRFKPRAAPVLSLAQKRHEKGLRKAITRSYRLLGSIAGAQTARACLDGDQIAVEGRKFDFRLRVANLRSTAHGAVEVLVTDKDAVELASLCIYINQTPALDQMAALILDVTAGNEDEIIRRANVIRSSEAASTNAAFREIRRKVERAIHPIPVPGGREPANQPHSDKDFLPTVERRLAETIDVAAWRPLIEIFGKEFRWQRFSTIDRAALAATQPWSRNRLSMTL
jgi:hypothetical protein